MDVASESNSLNKNQLEILKLFSRELDTKDLLEIKRLIVKYLANKVTTMADEIWEANSWTDDDIEKILKNSKRTPYNPNNK